MENPLSWLDHDEARRTSLFPVARKLIFLGHAGVTSLPQPVADAVIQHTLAACENQQEYEQVLRDIRATRACAARLIGASPEEIALLGPTSLGLSLVAGGLTWKAGDEIVCYADDYPANVYPWMDLARHGVEVRYLQPEKLGEITPEVVASAITPRTKLVALASCNFLSGYRIDVQAIGQLVHSRGALFCLDAIQTLGAFTTEVEHVDFLSADAHKWLLGPLAIGIVFVRKTRFEELHPILLGAANVRCPNFIAQESIQLRATAERYEPGVLNCAGIAGMKVAIDMLLEIGLEAVSARILALKQTFLEGVLPLGFEVLGPKEGPNASGITTLRHPWKEAGDLFRILQQAQILASHRFDRAGNGYLRFSPHYYNTHAEMNRVVEVLARAL